MFNPDTKEKLVKKRRKVHRSIKAMQNFNISARKRPVTLPNVKISEKK